MANRGILNGRPTFPTCQGGFPEAVCAPPATAPPKALPQICLYRLQLVWPSASSLLGKCHLPSFSTLQTSHFSVCTALLIYYPHSHWNPHKADCFCPHPASLWVSTDPVSHSRANIVPCTFWVSRDWLVPSQLFPVAVSRQQMVPTPYLSSHTYIFHWEEKRCPLSPQFFLGFLVEPSKPITTRNN